MKRRRNPFPPKTKNEIAKGKLFSYFRRGQGIPLVRLPDPYDDKLADRIRRGCEIEDLPKPWSEAYLAAYAAAEAGQELPARPAIGAGRSEPGTVASAVALYVKSAAFTDLAASSRQKYFRVLSHWRDQWSDRRIDRLETKKVRHWLAEMKPGSGADLLRALRALCKFLVDAGQLDVDPTAGIKFKRQKTAGHHSWTDDELALWFATHPIGSIAHTTVAAGLLTTQRRGDLAKMSWRDLDLSDGTIHVDQQKTGWSGDLAISPELAAVLDATPRTAFAILGLNKRGRPLTGPTLGAWFRRWRDEAGLPKRCTLHGLRKAFVRIAYERGVPPQHIAAQTGHEDLRVLHQHYGKGASQPRMAKAAVAKIENVIVQPSKPVGQTGS